MKYACMIYYDEHTLDTLSPSEYDALVREALAYDQELRESGHFILGQALESARSAAIVRPRAGGRITTSDGPLLETKEQLGGFVLIEARDLNEAIQLAARIPPARFGCVEVRPVKRLEPTER
ncbi:MAG TPA: YciI family protein [Candidatus Binatia bacterium]